MANPEVHRSGRIGWLRASVLGAMGAFRVTFWGAVAMALTYAGGAMFGAVV